MKVGTLAALTMIKRNLSQAARLPRGRVSGFTYANITSYDTNAYHVQKPKIEVD
jgi:hypothetical protein